MASLICLSRGIELSPFVQQLTVFYGTDSLVSVSSRLAQIRFRRSLLNCGSLAGLREPFLHLFFCQFLVAIQSQSAKICPSLETAWYARPGMPGRSWGLSRDKLVSRRRGLS